MIEVRNISKSFGEKQVLRGFSMKIEPGFTCLMAPSGGGKTTLLRLLMGLEKPDDGQILGMKGKRISAVFQEDRLCGSLSAAGNIKLVHKGVSEEALREGFAQMELDFADENPVRQWSGGMRRRAALLRALLAPHEVLLLDEPFKGLDAETKRKAMAFTKEKERAKTCLLVTHDAEEAAFFGGRIVTLQ